MKKFLLSLAACVSLFSANAQEYATTPETAQPLPAGGLFITDLSEYPAEMWFTYSQSTFPVAYCGQAPTVPSGEQQIAVYLCNGGQSAFQMTEGSDSYMLFSGKEYLVKI